MKLIVTAMESEASEIIKGFEKIDFEIPLYDLKNGFYLLITGIGKVNSASALASVINKYDINVIYSLGLIGATSHYNVGDIVILNEAKYHDFDLTLFSYEMGQVPGYPTVFKANQKLIDKAIISIPNVKFGLCLTGDYFMEKVVDYSALFDMETASLYQTAYRFTKPIIAIKVVSDIVGSKDHYDNYSKFEELDGPKRINEVFKYIIKGESI